MNDETPTREKWLNAYNDMMVRVRTAIEEAEEYTAPVLKRFIHNARDLAVDLEELTREEAEKVATYLHRDIEDAGKYLAETGKELGDWLRFDIDRIEDKLLSTLTQVTDHTGREIQEFQREIKEGPAWNSGEITGPGTLVCASCGTIIRFHKTGYIPNCPNCDHTVFHRKTVKDEL
jgi:rubrerythrin